MNIIECRNLVKHFGKVVALNGLSLSIPKNTFYGLIGPNGAGKTTTLRIILGLIKPDRGKVKLYGEDPWDNPKIRAEIGVIHEKLIFPPNISCIKFLRYVARIYGISNVDERINEVLKLVELFDARDRLIKGLSAGMLQRLGLAQALIHYPKLIIADEPTSNLDPLSRIKILNLMRKLKDDENVDFIISSHILPELARVCDRVAFIYNGRIAAEGSLEELYKKYRLAMFRISSSDSRKLLAELIKLPYIEEVSLTGIEIMVKVKDGFEQQLYSDVASIARNINVELYGIDFKVASLEELFRRIAI